MSNVHAPHFLHTYKRPDLLYLTKQALEDKCFHFSDSSKE